MAKGQKQPEVQPWERQLGESTQAFEAFACYRDMGLTRSIRKVAQRLSKSATLMARWSTGNEWVDRVARWDAEIDRQDRLERADMRRKVRKQTAKIANIAQLRALEAMQKVPAALWKPGEAARMLEVATKILNESLAEDEESTGAGDTPIIHDDLDDMGG